MDKTHFNFTEKTLAALPAPTNTHFVMYRDTGQRGLALMVTDSGAKTYYFCMKFQGVPKRVKIERFGDIKLPEARLRASEMRTAAARDKVDPAQKRNEELKDITLAQFYDGQYRPRHSVPYKRPKSIQKDDSMFKNYLAPLHNRKMMSVTRGEVERLHQELNERISPYTANRAITLLKHMYSKAHEWGFPKHHENPVTGIRMFKERSRDRFLQPDELARFFDALKDEPNQQFSNFVLLSLFIGQRKENMLSVRWSDVDLENGFIYFPDTKNGDAQRMPLTKQALEILAYMRQSATGKYLFPSKNSASGHIEDFHRPWYALLKRAEIENLRFHDLRRTFGSYQAINGASLPIIGKSLGHRSSGATAVYAHLTADPVRESMERATEKMLGYMHNE